MIDFDFIFKVHVFTLHTNHYSLWWRTKWEKKLISSYRYITFHDHILHHYHLPFFYVNGKFHQWETHYKSSFLDTPTKTKISEFIFHVLSTCQTPFHPSWTYHCRRVRERSNSTYSRHKSQHFFYKTLKKLNESTFPMESIMIDHFPL